MDASAGIGIAVSILTFAALPMLLVALAGLISHRQFRARWGTSRGVRKATSHPCSTASVQVLRATDVDVSAHPMRSDAVKAARDGQPRAYAAAIAAGRDMGDCARTLPKMTAPYDAGRDVRVPRFSWW